MAKIIITIEDESGEDGCIFRHDPVAKASFEVEATPDEENNGTLAILFGTAVRRLWLSRTLSQLSTLICDDMIRVERPKPKIVPKLTTPPENFPPAA